MANKVKTEITLDDLNKADKEYKETMKKIDKKFEELRKIK